MRNKTVFVVGAGANVDFNLPLGETLKTQIAEALREADSAMDLLEPNPLASALRNCHVADRANATKIQAATTRIIAGMPTAESIDNFVHQHREDPHLALVAKMAIVHCILKAESQCTLRPDSAPTTPPNSVNLLHEKNANSWLVMLFRAVTQGATLFELNERLRNLTLIIFNYDRCVEHFLFCTFISHYGVSVEKAQELMGLITFIHPYGIAAPLPWMHGDSDLKLAFGREPMPQNLVKLADNIKTFTENTDENDSLEHAHITLVNAETVGFLGFAFHQLNMKALKPPKELTTRGHADVFGTAYGLSDHQRGKIVTEITSTLGTTSDRVRLLGNKDTCPALFTEFFLR